MECQNCRFHNLGGAKFCNKCGAKLALICKGCDKPNPIGSKFCNGCGMNLDDRLYAQPPQVDKNRSYTPKFLTETYLSNRTAVEGERKPVTVMFADVADYTAMSEKLDPEEVHQIMDGCFKILMTEIHGRKGKVTIFDTDETPRRDTTQEDG